VVWVADTVEGFGEYVPYRVSAPRPVVGTQGLTAVAWHRSYEQYAGMQMQHRFERFAKRIMTESDYSAWIAVRAVGEAVTRSGKSDVPDIRARGLQGGGALVSALGPSASSAAPDHRRALASVDVAPGRLPSSEVSLPQPALNSS
jgi:ABC transporter substrate binding protein (PQQ-dependent alcohol dehydrogenase system)